MLSAGIHSARSSNWKPGLVRSNPNHSSRESRNTADEVHSATQRALRATCASSPRMPAMKTAPTSGRKVMIVRRWGMLLTISPSAAEQIPGHQDDDADQHREGVVIDVAGLQPGRLLGDILRDRGDAVGAKPIDDLAVPALP